MSSVFLPNCGAGCVRNSPPDSLPVRGLHNAAPIGIAALQGQRVALWGWGREGRAALRALRAWALHELKSAQSRETIEIPDSKFEIRHSITAASEARENPNALELTVFCSPEEAQDIRALGDPHLHAETDASAERLSAFDVVIKSPGISPYKPEALAATEHGTRFIGGTALWFAEHASMHPQTPVICVTGTKGKSTTTALLAHLLRAGGHRTALCGNIGLPLLELLEIAPTAAPSNEPDVWAIELSSYQTRDVAVSGVRPTIAIVTNLFPEHLDWHGGEARYIEDKLSLVTAAAPGIAVLNRADPILVKLELPESQIVWYGHAQGWHLREDTIYRGEDAVFDTCDVPLPGRHNRGNLCAVLAAIEALGFDAATLAPHAASFRPLPHRLQSLGERDGLLYVNDSISTTPHATLAALECFRQRPVAVIVGGHDRGLDWSAFAEAMREQAMQAQAPLAIITLGQNGPRIYDLLSPQASGGAFVLSAARDLVDAVALARAALSEHSDKPSDGHGGVVLLSPGAPSFGAYRDYTERGRHFAALAGFDPQAIATIPGLGIG
jgi:UDP-N-acetylmuramoyl-L-alanine---L-glutamate ligase